MNVMTGHEFYQSLEEAKSSVKLLGIRTMAVYRNNRYLDPRLPEHPDRFYAGDWAGERKFFGTIPAKYSTLTEASVAVRKMGFQSSAEYYRGYWVDPKLPQSPHKQYRDEWVSWFDFFDKEPRRHYKVMEVASSVARNLGVTNSTSYSLHYGLDPLLPARPDRVYHNEWLSWESFLGYGRYESLVEAQDAARRIGIRTSIEYSARYMEDARLPGCPHRFYKDSWISWPNFLGKRRYDTLEEWLKAVKEVGVKSKNDYLDRRALDPKLPSKPQDVFKDWPGWPEALNGGVKLLVKYSSYDEV